MKRILFITAAALLLIVQMQPAAAGPAAISESGATAISAFLKGAVDRGEVPGIVALVVDRQGVLYHEAFGKQDAARNVPMAKDTIFRIASMTKAVTSMGVMMLVEQGKLDLTDEASKWIPWLKNPQVISTFDEAAGAYETRPARRPITIEQLLTHTSGIGYTWSDPGLAVVQRKSSPKEEELPLANEPGERWTYGASTKVLGDIIEKISGQRIDAFLEARIMGPLGMSDTVFEVPRSKYSRVVTIHQKANGKLTEQPNPETLPVSLRADGGLFSTAGDYGQFLRMILNNGELGGKRLLSERTLKNVGRNHMGSTLVRLQPSANGALSQAYPLGAGTDKWGLGFQLAGKPSAPGTRSEGSMAWAGIFNTEFWVDPKERIGVILLMQMLPFYDAQAIEVLQGFEKLVYQNLK